MTHPLLRTLPRTPIETLTRRLLRTLLCGSLMSSESPAQKLDLLTILETVLLGLLGGGVKATLCASCAIVCDGAHLWPFGPFCKGIFRREMMTSVGNYRHLRTRTLSPHVRVPI